MAVLEQRGVFWWSDEVVPERLLAPDSRIAGTLIVEDSGRAVLELDGYFEGPHGPMAAFNPEPVKRCIQGLLKSSGDRILLCDISRNGGHFSTSAICFERFVARHCLIAQSGFEANSKAPMFNAQTIPLRGFEEWLRLGAINVENRDTAISAKYETLNDLIYSDGDELLTIVFDIDIDGSGMPRPYAYSLKQAAYAKLESRNPKSLEDLFVQFGLFEDLLKLLTGSGYELPWPKLSLPDGSECSWYFQRMTNREKIEPPSHFDTATIFPELRDTFGAIWFRWKSKREEFGPGIYLYLGTQRGFPMYIEHRFVNLVWGLEAFHRKKDSLSSKAIVEKVSRILERIEDKEDRRWLAYKLRNAHEPSLENRLFETLKLLPIGLDSERLKNFCGECASRRNDISHFGGSRRDAAYSDFLKDLHIKSEALSNLYHALLLHELGISEQILKRWMFDSFCAGPIKMHLVQAGLLDQSSIQPPSGPTARQS